MPGRTLVNCSGEPSHHLQVNSLERELVANPDVLFFHGNSRNYADEFGEHFGLVLLDVAGH
jgi:hypothetical protein